MTSARTNLILLGIAALGLSLVWGFAPATALTFDGHAFLVEWVVEMLLWMLAGTHAFLAVVMLVRARGWTPSEAALFRFIAIKALFWLAFALQHHPRESGVNAITAYLIVIIAVSTLDLDVQLVRRYFFGSEERLTPSPEQ